MAALNNRDEHNNVAFLENTKRSADYHPRGVRSQLQLDDDGGVEDLPIADIYLSMDNLGYPTEGKPDLLQKQILTSMRFLVHTILHCLSTKSGSWDQFGSPLAIALICLTEGRSVPSNPQTYPMRLHEPDHSHDHASTPPRPTTTTSSAPVNEQVSTLVQKVNTQESELKAHKLLFKEVVGKLVQKVKLLEDKLKGRKRKFMMTDILIRKDAGGGGGPDVDPLIKLAKAAATAVPTGGSHKADILPSSSIPFDEFASGSDVPASATTGPSVDPSNKGKFPLVEEEDPPVRERTFRQREEDRLGEEAARRMYEEEQDELEREREEMQRKRQQDVLNSAKYYTDSDWTDIMGQVHANQGLTADLLGPDVNEDNFAKRIVALIAKIKREFAAQRFQDKRNKPMTYAQQKAYMRTLVKNQSSTIYTTGWTMKHVKSFSDDQLKTEFDKIRTAVAELQSQNIRRSLKRPGADLEQASSKKSKPTEAPKSSVPDESQQPSAEVPPTATQQPSEFSSQPTVPSAEPRTHSYGTRRKSLGARKNSSTELDLTADDRSFIRVLSDDSDDSNDDDDPPIFWPAFAAWEVVPTGLGDVNALYFMDKSSKYFTHLREILHLVDRKDLFKLYGMVVQYYEEHPLAGYGMILWGDLQVLFESHEGGTGAGVWQINSNGLSGVRDTPYPLSAQLMKKMLKHKLEVEIAGIGNDMTYAEQLIYPRLDADFLVADSKFMKVAFGVGFKMLLFNPLEVTFWSSYFASTSKHNLFLLQSDCPIYTYTFLSNGPTNALEIFLFTRSSLLPPYCQSSKKLSSYYLDSLMFYTLLLAKWLVLVASVIPPIDLPEAVNNWANAFAKAHQDPNKNKLHNKIDDIGSFIGWYCRRIGKEELSKADLEGPAFMMVKGFHENIISLQFQMEECHKFLTNQIDLVNPEGHRIV
ncbi:hypothetical protein Tco_1377880 [Tanacetum coccineum]